MHGLIFETSVWLLAESTRFPSSHKLTLAQHSTLSTHTEHSIHTALLTLLTHTQTHTCILPYKLLQHIHAFSLTQCHTCTHPCICFRIFTLCIRTALCFCHCTTSSSCHSWNAKSYFSCTLLDNASKGIINIMIDAEISVSFIHNR